MIVVSYRILIFLDPKGTTQCKMERAPYFRLMYGYTTLSSLADITIRTNW